MADGEGGNVDWSLRDRESLGRIDQRLNRIESMLADVGGGMDAWQQSVETRLGQLDANLLDIRGEIRGLRSGMWSQFRWLLGILIAAFAVTLGTIAQGFGWI